MYTCDITYTCIIYNWSVICSVTEEAWYVCKLW